MSLETKGPDGMPDPHREWELQGKLHRSREDAYAQVYKARVGSTVAATNTYLNALRVFVRRWLEEIENELRKRGEL